MFRLQFLVNHIDHSFPNFLMNSLYLYYPQMPILLHWEWHILVPRSEDFQLLCLPCHSILYVQVRFHNWSGWNNKGNRCCKTQPITHWGLIYKKHFLNTGWSCYSILSIALRPPLNKNIQSGCSTFLSLLSLLILILLSLICIQSYICKLFTQIYIELFQT